jgi:hypothetical protein
VAAGKTVGIFTPTCCHVFTPHVCALVSARCCSMCVQLHLRQILIQS